MELLADPAWVDEHESATSRFHGFTRPEIDSLDFAAAIFETDEPTESQQRSTRRALQALAASGDLQLRRGTRTVERMEPGWVQPHSVHRQCLTVSAERPA